MTPIVLNQNLHYFTMKEEILNEEENTPRNFTVISK